MASSRTGPSGDVASFGPETNSGIDGYRSRCWKW